MPLAIAIGFVSRLIRENRHVFLKGSKLEVTPQYFPLRASVVPAATFMKRLTDKTASPSWRTKPAASLSFWEPNAVSFKLFLDQRQTILDNQFFLAFQAVPGKKPGLQRVKISTEVPKVDIVAANNVWVRTPGQPAGKGKGGK